MSFNERLEFRGCGFEICLIKNGIDNNNLDWIDDTATEEN